MLRGADAAARNRRAVESHDRIARLTETGLAPRRAAVVILAAVRRGLPFDVALEREIDPLTDADRRLAHELAAGVLRHAGPLDTLLGNFIPRGIGSVAPPLLDVLRIGAYQLRMLDRIPAHAAVTTSVALARERAGERVTGFTNAVLRRIAQMPPGDPAREDLDDVARLAGKWSHPAWLVARWLARFGAGDTDALLAWNNSRPALIVQPGRGALLDLERRFDADGVRCAPAPYGAGVEVHASHPERLPGFAAGDFFVQDAAQALVIRFCAIPAGALVYDACAAPGGKTLALSHQGARVVAADGSIRRIRRLHDNIARAGTGNETVVAADAMHPPLRQVDAYLLDAPCLGTGTFARHPDARLRVTEEALLHLAAQQAAMLDAAAARVAPGGLLCYATCSLEPEENDMQITGFLRHHPEFSRQPPDDFPRELLTPAGDLVLLPQRDGIDGAFAARLRRIR
ncbi:MAG: transcription antitermination factor NusB [Gemmatimonadales bacterium]